MFRCFFKKMYDYAYRYARSKQKVYFKMYLQKYIQKHIKYRSVHNEEYNVLTVNAQDDILLSLKTNIDHLLDYLYSNVRNTYDQKKKYQSFRLCSVESHIQDTMQQYRYEMNPTVLCDLVTFAFAFHQVFLKSDLTAKTKLQEHWCMRLPVYVLCLTLVLVIRWLEDAHDHWFLVFVVYFMSIGLVFLRFHQSVSADTKKLSSELYTEYKHKLLISLSEDFIE